MKISDVKDLKTRASELAQQIDALFERHRLDNESGMTVDNTDFESRQKELQQELVDLINDAIKVSDNSGALEEEQEDGTVNQVRDLVEADNALPYTDESTKIQTLKDILTGST